MVGGRGVVPVAVLVLAEGGVGLHLIRGDPLEGEDGGDSEGLRLGKGLSESDSEGLGEGESGSEAFEFG